MAYKVVIVGGGSAGWMTATYLAKMLKDVHVTLIESGNIRTIGVGEATFSTIKLFFDALGLEEHDWMPHCSASYKLAIRFVDWTKQRRHFYHPFQRLEKACGLNGAEWWMKLRRDQPFDYACFTIPRLCDAMRSPRFLDGTVFDDRVRDYYTQGRTPPNASILGHEVQYPYAYHFNAAELADYLATLGIGMGVERLVDDVVEVLKHEDGSLRGVRTKGRGDVVGDLFVDCTGFRGLLINQALGEPFVSFQDSLLNDSAVAIQVPRDIERDGIRPYTTAHAHSAGWSWNIPLYGRDGTGYVYCSQFIDKTEAERELRQFLGPAADNASANHIKMRIGRCRRSWVKNCVAIGLASGFVEPLESTGIFFIQHGIEELVNHFPGPEGIDPRATETYNKVIGECIDGVREFLTLHYCSTDRDDTPFWRATKSLKLPDTLRERMEWYRARLPSDRTIYQPYHGFETYSWIVMLLGLNYLPGRPLPILDHKDEARARAMFDAIQARGEELARTLPSQYEYLTNMRLHRAGAERVPPKQSSTTLVAVDIPEGSTKGRVA